MESRVESILETAPIAPDQGEEIGRSRQGRPLRAFRLGGGPLRIGLIAGCHADEPIGPAFLRRLAAHLSRLDAADPLLRDNSWWIVPHMNPDGEERNRWWSDGEAACDLVSYLTRAVRELPGDDVEFGFPRDEADLEARPENRAAMEWWRREKVPFDVHASLHGMAFGGGPWFLIEPAWIDRTTDLRRQCAERTAALGYALHDVERKGEKGFYRIERGFCSRPDSSRMASHFESLGDREMARLFRPSSMEAIRSLGGDPLTLVSEMPLFITPGVGDEIGPPDPKALEWKKKIDAWRAQLAKGQDPGRIQACSGAGCLAPMPVDDQMRLQCAMIAAGIEEAARRKS